MQRGKEPWVKHVLKHKATLIFAYTPHLDFTNTHLMILWQMILAHGDKVKRDLNNASISILRTKIKSLKCFDDYIIPACNSNWKVHSAKNRVIDRVTHTHVPNVCVYMHSILFSFVKDGNSKKLDKGFLDVSTTRSTILVLYMCSKWTKRQHGTITHQNSCK